MILDVKLLEYQVAIETLENQQREEEYAVSAKYSGSINELKRLQHQRLLYCLAQRNYNIGDKVWWESPLTNQNFSYFDYSRMQKQEGKVEGFTLFMGQIWVHVIVTAGDNGDKHIMRFEDYVNNRIRDYGFEDR